MVKECQLREKIKFILKTKYPNSLVLPLSDRYHKGYPDLVVLFNGDVWFIELKTPKGKLSKLQQYYLNKIKQCGGKVAVIRSIEQFLTILKGETK